MLGDDKKKFQDGSADDRREERGSGRNSSDTSAFIQKMEEARRRKPCHSLVDMRGKVPGICRQYEYKGKDFYMDDASYVIFQQGLAEHGGVFTVGIFEEITEGTHTFKGLQRLQKESDQAEADLLSDQSGGTASGTDDTSGLPGLEIVEFGYSRKRHQDRISYVTDLIVCLDGASYPAKTRDLSTNGMQIYMAYVLDAQAGKRIAVEFAGSAEQGNRTLQNVPYQIVRCEQRGKQVSLALKRITAEDEASVIKSLDKLIERNKSRNRIDLHDAITAATAQIYERIYTDSSLSLPLFYRKGESGCKLITGICPANQGIVDFFKTPGLGHDFSALHLGAWFAPKWKEVVDEGKTVHCTLALYKTGAGVSARIEVIEFDEVKSYKHAFLAWRYASMHGEFRIMTLKLSPVGGIPQERLVSLLQPLHDLDEGRASSLLEDLNSIEIIGSLMDITESVSRQICGSAKYKDLTKESIGNGLTKLLGRQLDAGGDAVTNQNSTESVHFGYTRQRKEDRYLIDTEVLIYDSEGQKMPARTLDISLHGIGLHLDHAAALYPGAKLGLSFGSPQSFFSLWKTKKIPYRVVARSQDGEVLGLAREARPSDDRECNVFFHDLFKENRDKLKVEVGDVQEDVAARIYEILYTAEMHSVPFFMGKDDEGVFSIDRVALNATPCALAGFFGNKKYFDFSVVNKPERLRYLNGLVTSMKTSGQNTTVKPGTMTVFIYRDAGGNEGNMISAADFELPTSADRETFIKQMLNSGQYRIVKVSIMPVLAYTDEQLSGMIVQLTSLSMSHARKLHARLRRLLGVGEVVDITREYLISML